MIIPGREAYEMGCVKNLINPELQVQPAGIELTLREVGRIVEAGHLDLTNKNRYIPRMEVLNFDSEGKIHLVKGAYRIMFNEIVSLPPNIAAIGYPRSSLIRSGATIYMALWDPGYVGRSVSLLSVFNEKGIILEKNSRLIQLVFIRLEKVPHKIYRGKYQKENIEFI